MKKVKRNSYLTELAKRRPLLVFAHIISLVISVVLFIPLAGKYLTIYPNIDQLKTHVGILKEVKHCSGLRCSSKAKVTIDSGGVLLQFDTSLAKNPAEDLAKSIGKIVEVKEKPKPYFDFFLNNPRIAEIKVNGRSFESINYDRMKAYVDGVQEHGGEYLRNLGLIIVANLFFILYQIIKLERNPYYEFKRSDP